MSSDNDNRYLKGTDVWVIEIVGFGIAPPTGPTACHPDVHYVMVKHSTNDLLTDTNDSRKETVFIRNDIISCFLLDCADGKSMRYVVVNV